MHIHLWPSTLCVLFKFYAFKGFPPSILFCNIAKLANNYPSIWGSEGTSFPIDAYHESLTTEVVLFCAARRGVNCGYKIGMRTRRSWKDKARLRGWGKRTPIAVINFQVNSGPDRSSITTDVKGIGGWNERPFVTASGWIIPWEIFIPLSCYSHVFHGFIELFVPVGIVYIGWGPNRCNRWGFFFCWGCSFFFSGSLCCSFEWSLLCSLLRSIFCLTCFSIKCAEISIPSVNTVLASTTRTLLCRGEGSF